MPPTPSPHRPLHPLSTARAELAPPEGAQVYAQALCAAGGQQLAALALPCNPNRVAAALYASPPYDLHVAALPVARLSITLTAACVTGALEGDRPRAYDTRRLALFLNPAGAAAHWRKESPSRHLNLYFHPSAFCDPEGHGEGGAADGGGEDARRAGAPQPAPLLNLQVPGLQPVVTQLLTELQMGEAWSAEAADSLGRLLLIKVGRHVARQRRNARGTTSAKGSRLSPTQLARLQDYVQAHLAQRLLVADMAQALNLSPQRFAALFSASTGGTPHQLVLATRLQHATALLTGSPLPLAEVAGASGFSSQQHLTSLMRKRLGTTPGQYRQGRRAAATTPPAEAVPPLLKVDTVLEAASTTNR